MSFLGEIKRRKVFQVAAVYLVASWLIMQVVDVVAEPLLLPDWFPRVVIVLLAIGFPIAIILSWAFDLTARGVERTPATTSGEEVPTENLVTTTGLAVNLAVIGALALALIAAGAYVLWRDGPATTAREAGAQSQSQDSADDVPAVLPNSVAVLLCHNLSPDPEDAFFAEGIHEEILNQLMKVRSLTPIARTSVLQYADGQSPISQIAEELRVESIMQCSVRYAGDAVRVTAQLIDPRTSLQLWQGAYNGDRSDVSALFEMQADIAMNIANALQAEFSSEEQQQIEKLPTSSPEAYALYLKAMQSQGAERQSYLDQALEIDPDFGLIYALRAVSLANGLFNLGINVELGDSRTQLENQVLELAERALGLDPDLGLAYTAQAMIHELNWRWADAAEAHDRAMRFDQTNSATLRRLSIFRRRVGDYSESIRLAERAVEFDPANPFSFAQLGIAHMYAQNHDEALAAFRTQLAIRPNNMASIMNTVVIHNAAGRTSEALEWLERFEPEGPTDLAWLTMGYSKAGRAAEAERFFGQLESMADDRDVGSANLALAYLALGDAESSLRWFRQAIDEKALEDRIPLAQMKANIWRDPILDRVEFQELREAVGSL